MTTALARQIEACLKAKNITFIILIFLFVVSISPVYADVGLPMLAIVWPLFWLAFIPIVLIEHWVLMQTFKAENHKRILFITGWANLCSTVIGIPITYIILVLIQMMIPGGDGTFPDFPEFWRRVLSVTLQAPWLIPYEPEFYWMIPVSCSVLFIPFYFISSWIEGKIVYHFLKDSYQSEEVKKAVWKANRASYAFLYIIVTGWLIYGLSTKKSILGLIF